MKKIPQLTIFFPCYNDAGSIRNLVEQAFEIGKNITDELEIVVVDDGSRDGSQKILAELVGLIPVLRVCFHSKNTGYGGALREGFSLARNDFIFYTDGDAQYDLRELSFLVEEMKDGVDLVNGYKLSRADRWYRRFLGDLYRKVIGFLFGIKLKDINCAFKLFRRQLLKEVNLESCSGAICIEMLAKFQRKGAVFREVAVHHYPRRYGRSQFFSFRHISYTIVEIFVLWWKLKFFKDKEA